MRVTTTKTTVTTTLNGKTTTTVTETKTVGDGAELPDKAVQAALDDAEKACTEPLDELRAGIRRTFQRFRKGL